MAQSQLNDHSCHPPSAASHKAGSGGKAPLLLRRCRCGLLCVMGLGQRPRGFALMRRRETLFDLFHCAFFKHDFPVAMLSVVDIAVARAIVHIAAQQFGVELQFNRLVLDLAQARPDGFRRVAILEDAIQMRGNIGQGRANTVQSLNRHTFAMRQRGVVREFIPFKQARKRADEIGKADGNVAPPSIALFTSIRIRATTAPPKDLITSGSVKTIGAPTARLITLSR